MKGKQTRKAKMKTTTLPSRITDKVLKTPNKGSKHEVILQLVEEHISLKNLNASDLLEGWDNEDENTPRSEDLTEIIEVVNSNVWNKIQRQLSHNFTIMALERLEAGFEGKTTIKL